jgi:hypothetical protein
VILVVPEIENVKHLVLETPRTESNRTEQKAQDSMVVRVVRVPCQANDVYAGESAGSNAG